MKSRKFSFHTRQRSADIKFNLVSKLNEFVHQIDQENAVINHQQSKTELPDQKTEDADEADHQELDLYPQLIKNKKNHNRSNSYTIGAGIEQNIMLQSTRDPYSSQLIQEEGSGEQSLQTIQLNESNSYQLEIQPVCVENPNFFYAHNNDEEDDDIVNQ